eukprot:gene12147-5638_t
MISETCFNYLNTNQERYTCDTKTITHHSYYGNDKDCTGTVQSTPFDSYTCLNTSDPKYNMRYECENKDLKDYVTEQFYFDDKCTQLYQTHGYPENSCFSKLVGAYQKAFCTKTHVQFQDFRQDSTCSPYSKNDIVREMKLGECIKVTPYIYIKYTCPRESVVQEPPYDPTTLIVIISSIVVVSLLAVAIVTAIIVLVVIVMVTKSKSKQESAVYDGLEE